MDRMPPEPPAPNDVESAWFDAEIQEDADGGEPTVADRGRVPTFRMLAASVVGVMAIGLLVFALLTRGSKGPQLVRPAPEPAAKAVEAKAVAEAKPAEAQVHRLSISAPPLLADAPAPTSLSILAETAQPPPVKHDAARRASTPEVRPSSRPAPAAKAKPKSTATKNAPAKPTPAKPTPAKSTKPTPTKVTPAKPAPAKSTKPASKPDYGHF